MRVGVEGIDLVLQSGQVMHMPARDREEMHGDRTRRWQSTDFSGLSSDCERCGGWHDKHTGEMSGSSGIIAVGVLRKRDEHGKWVASGPHDRWCRIAAACSCAYGAWRHQVQGMPFADRLPDVVGGLTAREWVTLIGWHEAGDSYLLAAERVRGIPGWDEVVTLIRRYAGEPDAERPKENGCQTTEAASDDLPF
jgi:hypothetical protein